MRKKRFEYCYGIQDVMLAFQLWPSPSLTAEKNESATCLLYSKTYSSLPFHRASTAIQGEPNSLYLYLMASSASPTTLPFTAKSEHGGSGGGNGNEVVPLLDIITLHD